ncbi:hypothetical protein BDF22DRAFT_225307 [Syncephalis plumigaleata]|nr:hypothetical protein BDF22DRAFT_225307 [Syncephalis plumigaleata]
MDPLHQFGFDKKDNDIEYFCHLYSYINGVLLSEYFKEHTVSQAFIITSEILSDIIKGLIYLYNAGIIHYDLHPRNIMLQQDPTGRIVGVKIIDLDATEVFRKQFFWKPINPNNEEYLSPNPRQNYESCHGLKDAIKDFLEPFVLYFIHQTHNPYTSNYGITGEVAFKYLETFNQRPRYAKLELGDAKAAMSAVFRLTRAYYTIEYDRFTCSSPMRALGGLPPRTL